MFHRQKKKIFLHAFVYIPKLFFLNSFTCWASGFSCLHVFLHSSSSNLNINTILLKTHQEIYICPFSPSSNLLAELNGIMTSAPVMDTQERHSEEKYLFRQSLVRFIYTGSYLIAMTYSTAHLYIHLLHKEPWFNEAAFKHINHKWSVFWSWHLARNISGDSSQSFLFVPQDASAAIFGSLVAFREVLLQFFHQAAQQFRWRVTPVHSSGAFSLLIKDVRQRKLSFNGGEEQSIL